MRLLILSDLHLEWGPYDPPPADTYDAVVLAGDIRHGNEGLEWAQREGTFGHRPVVLVAGNHEYYGSEFHETRQSLRDAAQGTNVHFLDRDELVLEGSGGERVRFLGATLWTDFAVYGEVESAMNRARRGLNDFVGSIRWQDGLVRSTFRPEDSVAEHLLSRAWLSERLADPRVEGVTTVVVTHHAPSSRSIAPQWQGHDLSPCFASNLPLSFFEVPQFWAHGHVHDSFDYRLGLTSVVANPRGYRRREGVYENRRFDPGLVIDTSSVGTVDAEAPAGIGEAEALSNALRRAARNLGLTADVVASAIGMSAQEATAVLIDRLSLEPRSEGGRRAMKLVRLSTLLGVQFGYGDDRRRAWVQGRFESLDGAVVELIQTEEGLDAIVDYLEALRAR